MHLLYIDVVHLSHETISLLLQNIDSLLRITSAMSIQDTSCSRGKYLFLFIG